MTGDITPGATAIYSMTDFRQAAGASVLFAMDVGAWDNSMAINTPGHSGDPLSPHYRDLFPLQAARGYVPLRHGREAVNLAGPVGGLI